MVVAPHRAADWNLTDWCNYRCTYCTSGEGKHATNEVIDEVFRFFRDVFRPAEVVLCGGEPTFHPRFPEIIAFCGQHGIEVRLDSNLSIPGERLAEILDGLQGTPIIINATWHHEFASFERFVDNVSLLRERGVPVEVRLIALSAEEGEVRERYRRLQEAGMAPILKVEKSRRRGDGVVRRTRIGAGYDPDYRAWIAAELGQSLEELAAETEYRSYLGQLCQAGQTYVYIEDDGLVYPCGAYVRFSPSLGHVRDLQAPWQGTAGRCVAPVCKCREAERFNLLLPEPAAASGSAGAPGPSAS